MTSKDIPCAEESLATLCVRDIHRLMHCDTPSMFVVTGKDGIRLSNKDEVHVAKNTKRGPQTQQPGAEGNSAQDKDLKGIFMVS
jgi:hypothetical protein